MLERNNVTNVSFHTENNNGNNGNNVGKVTKAAVNKADAIAMKLVDRLGSPTSYKFYCKVAYTLPESVIWSNYEKAILGNNPGGLFNWLCRKEMAQHVKQEGTR